MTELAVIAMSEVLLFLWGFISNKDKETEKKCLESQGLMNVYALTSCQSKRPTF